MKITLNEAYLLNRISVTWYNSWNPSTETWLILVKTKKSCYVHNFI